MKKISLLFIWIFSFLCFAPSFTTSKLTSAKASEQKENQYIMLALDIGREGTITQSLVFGCDGERAGDKRAQLVLALVDKVEEIRKEFLFSFALYYLQNPVEQYKINSGVLLSPTSYIESLDGVGFSIVFSSSGAWNYYHAVEESETSRPLFLKKIESRGSFPFSAKRSDQTLVGDFYKSKFLSACDEVGLNLAYSPTYIYNYSLPSNRYKADANLTYLDSNRQFHYVWKKLNLQGDEKILIYYYQINGGMWILTALLIPLLSLSLYAIIIRAKKGKNRAK